MQEDFCMKDHIFFRRGTRDYPEVSVNKESRKAEEARLPGLNNYIRKANNFRPVGSTSALFGEKNPEHWPHVASLAGEHHPCVTLDSTGCFISPTRTPRAFCQRGANTHVHSRAAQLSAETHI